MALPNQKRSAHTLAVELVQWLLQADSAAGGVSDDPCSVYVRRAEEVVRLQVTPFTGAPGAADAARYFEGVQDGTALYAALQRARSECWFEEQDAASRTHLHEFASHFQQQLEESVRAIPAEEVSVLAPWLARLDSYCAVKALESLAARREDRELLLLAVGKGWEVHFDHLAIRCGSESRGDGQRIASQLCSRHGYARAQLAEQQEYRFTDGWNAYPVYKLLENGELLRVFVDESADESPAQIIQHWNHLYGFTAHHLAMRATCIRDNERHAIPLDEVREALAARRVPCMQPTGAYTLGLLEQVFTRPQLREGLPDSVLAALRRIDPQLVERIANAKLIELVSRREMPPALAHRRLRLAGIVPPASGPPPSVPVYDYFLPAQAAHVIRTSVQSTWAE